MKKTLLAGVCLLGMTGISLGATLNLPSGWSFKRDSSMDEAGCVLMNSLPDGRVFNLFEIVSGPGKIDSMVTLANPGMTFKKNHHLLPVQISFDKGGDRELWFKLDDHWSTSTLTPDQNNWIESSMFITGSQMKIVMDYDDPWTIDLPQTLVPSFEEFQSCVHQIHLLSWKIKH